MAATFGFVSGALDFFFTQGEDFEMPIVLTAPDIHDPSVQVPVNLTGCSFRSQVKEAPGGLVVFDFAVAPCDIVIDSVDPAPPTGLVTFRAPRSVTHVVPAGSYVYDIFLLNSLGKDHPYFTGQVTCNGQVTDPSA